VFESFLIIPLLLVHNVVVVVEGRDPDEIRHDFLFEIETVNEYDDDESYEDEDDDEIQEKTQHHRVNKFDRNVNDNINVSPLVREYNPSLTKSLTDEIYQQYNYVLNSVEGVRIKPSFLEAKYNKANRVILWYHPYCAHSQKFKKTFLRLAKETNDLITTDKDDIEFHAISCAVHHWLCNEYEVKSFPIVWVQRKNSSNYKVMNEFTAEIIVQNLGLTITNDTLDKPFPTSRKESGPIINKYKIDIEENEEEIVEVRDILGASNDIYKRTRKDVFHDASVSFIHAITTHKFHSKTKSNALLEYIDLLFWSLPPSYKLLTIINAIRSDLKERELYSSTKSDVLHEYNAENVIEYHKDFVLDNVSPQWTASCASKSKGRKDDHNVIDYPPGYQCGLWNLFHIVSIGVAERHRAVLGGRDRVSTEYAALSIRDFISNHLLEDEEQNLTKDDNKHNIENRMNQNKYWNRLLALYSRDCGYRHDRCNRFTRKKINKESASHYSDTDHWREFALWLWEVHNEMKIETLKYQMKIIGRTCCSKNEEMDVLYPSIDECPACYLPNGKWNRHEVYSLLKNQYWPSGINNFRYVVLDVKGEKKEQSTYYIEDYIDSTFAVLALSVLLYLVWSYSSRKRLLSTVIRSKHHDD